MTSMDAEGSGFDGRDSQALAGAWYPDERFADERGDVPSFSPEPEPPGTSAEEWERLDRLADEWEARHAGPDIVQPFDEWKADLAAGRDYVSQWEDEHGPIVAAAEDRADWPAGAPDYDAMADAIEDEELEL